MSVGQLMRSAYSDIHAALSRYDLASVFGWQDVAQRYRRSRIGAFWITINMGVLIGALGLIFGSLFRAPMEEFLPFICAGLIFWSFIVANITEGCNAFISAESMILQVRIPLFSQILRILWKNTIILGHNLIIYPILMIIFGKILSIYSLYAIIGVILLWLNLSWMMLFLATFCARYRDMIQIIQNIMQVLFYATPLLWMPEILPERFGSEFLTLNPFYHLISIVRSPLLGSLPTWDNWAISAAMAVAGWALALAFFGRYRMRIPYWL